MIAYVLVHPLSHVWCLVIYQSPESCFNSCEKNMLMKLDHFPPRIIAKKIGKSFEGTTLAGEKNRAYLQQQHPNQLLSIRTWFLRENRSLYKFIRILPYTESLTAGVLGITTKTKPSIPTNIPRLFQNSSLIFGCEDIPSRLSWRANGYVNFSGCGTKKHRVYKRKHSSWVGISPYFHARNLIELHPVNIFPGI